MTTQFDPETLGKIQTLIEGNFTGRDELYAAADSMDNDARVRICRNLAEHLAMNAIELQQIVAASGVNPAQPLDLEAIAHALFELVKANHGDLGVLKAAAEGEHLLKRDYDAAIGATRDPEAKAILEKQREQVEFAEDVLKSITDEDR